MWLLLRTYIYVCYIPEVAFDALPEYGGILHIHTAVVQLVDD